MKKVAAVPAARSSARQREQKQRRDRELLHAILLIEANAVGLAQREADRAEDKGRSTFDAKDTDTEGGAAERVPLSDRMPAQETTAPEHKDESSVQDPSKHSPKGRKVNAATPKTKTRDPKPAVSMKKVDKPSTNAKEGAAEVVRLQPKQTRVILRMPNCDVPAESQPTTNAEKAGVRPSAAKVKSAKRPRITVIEDTKAPAVGIAKRARSRK